MYTLSDPKRPVEAFTWATKPLPDAVGLGAKIFISDIGVNGSFWYSTGTRWQPVGGSVNVIQSGKPFLVNAMNTADASTYSQSGTTITVTSTGHGIPATTFNGGSVYLDIKTGSATDGWYTNLTRTGANDFTCVSTTSQTTSGDLTTNTAATTITPLTTTLPAGIMGANGRLEANIVVSCIDSANDKTFTLKFGSDTWVTRLLTTAGNTSSESEHFLANRNNQAKQVRFGASLIGGVGEPTATALSYGTIDSSAAVDLTALITVATADEWMVLESLTVKLFPGY